MGTPSTATDTSPAALLERALQGLCAFERSASTLDARSREFLRTQLLMIVQQRALELQAHTRALRRDLPEL